MRTSDFDFDLPEERIARVPLSERDASRLLVLPRTGGPAEDRAFRDLPSLLRAGDLLVVNDARVIHARLRGAKEETGGRVELLLAEPLPPQDGLAAWRCMAGSSKPLRIGGNLRLGEGGEVRARVVGIAGEGFVDVAFDRDPDALLAAVERIGELPLPPYLNRAPEPEDDLRYQTVFARRPGAVAAPTAGLHFTDATFAALAARGVRTASITLYVGPGTFLPVRGEDVAGHRMHAERYEIPEATTAAIARTRADGGRVIAVGTTSLRALEASAADGAVRPGPGCTDIFIVPGYRFRAIDGLVTNFHLPRSTLVMLVSALAGRERLLAAYAHAVAAGYRFYSYGDAMLVL
jgi:S-adenosylmethionine:tRNA ribosyltransferase-isomerase